MARAGYHLGVPRAIRIVVVLTGLFVAAGCEGPRRTTSPTPHLTLTFIDPVSARMVACQSCAPPTTHLVSEFTVTVGDPAGPGGSVETVTTVVRNTSRGLDVGRNVRPNRDFAYPSTMLPPRGSLTLEAGIVIDPPPPRDALEISVSVRLTDGRTVSRASRLVAATS